MGDTRAAAEASERWQMASMVESSEASVFSDAHNFQAFEVPEDIAPLVANLAKEGYTLDGMSHHQYDSTVTSEKLRDLGGDHLAAAGIHVSDTDASTVTAREDITYYTFTNPETESKRILTVMQLVGADGVTPQGNRVVVESPVENVNPHSMEGRVTTMGFNDTVSKIWNWVKENPNAAFWLAVIIIAAIIALSLLVGWLITPEIVSSGVIVVGFS